MTVKWDILVSMGGLAIDVKVESSVRIANDLYVKHGDTAVLFDFFCPFYAGVDGVEVCVEGVYVVVADGSDCVIGLPVPEENDVTGTDVVVTCGVFGIDMSLKIFHVDVR